MDIDRCVNTIVIKPLPKKKCNYRDPLLIGDWDGTVDHCLHHSPRPETPEKIRIFDKWNNTKIADHRIYPALVKDSQLEVARQMKHGKTFKQGYSINEILQPQLLTPLADLIRNHQESIYFSSRRAPLGHFHKPDLPDCLDPVTTTFGLPTPKSEGAGPLLNPDKRTVELLQQDLDDRKTYLKSYKSIFPGEQAHRTYTTAFDPNTRFGFISHGDKTGRCVKELMNWSGSNNKLHIASERLMEYFDRNQAQLGKSLDPIRDTMNVPPDFTFGKKSEMGATTVNEVMRGYAPRNILGLTAPHGTPLIEGPGANQHCTSLTERENIIRRMLKHQLSAQKYKRGPELSAVLCELAQGEDNISEQLAQAVYEEFKPPLDDEMREILFDIVRMENYDKGGGEKVTKPAVTRLQDEPKTINWRLLANLLDYNRLTPFDKYGDPQCFEEKPCVSKIVECADTVRLRLAKAIKSRNLEMTTTNQIYGGDRNGILNTKLWRPLGMTTVQRHKRVPCPLRLADYRTYGDIPGVHSLLNPAIMTTCNIGQVDILSLRSKQEMKDILKLSGVVEEIENDCQFNQLWNMAKLRDQTLLREFAQDESDDRATLDSFRAALRECNRQKVTAAVNQKYLKCCS